MLGTPIRTNKIINFIFINASKRSTKMVFEMSFNNFYGTLIVPFMVLPVVSALIIKRKKIKEKEKHLLEELTLIGKFLRVYRVPSHDAFACTKNESKICLYSHISEFANMGMIGEPRVV